MACPYPTSNKSGIQRRSVTPFLRWAITYSISRSGLGHCSGYVVLLTLSNGIPIQRLYTTQQIHQWALRKTPPDENSTQKIHMVTALHPANTKVFRSAPMSMTSPRTTLPCGHNAPLSLRPSAVPRFYFAINGVTACFFGAICGTQGRLLHP